MRFQCVWLLAGWLLLINLNGLAAQDAKATKKATPKATDDADDGETKPAKKSAAKKAKPAKPADADDSMAGDEPKAKKKAAKKADPEEMPKDEPKDEPKPEDKPATEAKKKATQKNLGDPQDLPLAAPTDIDDLTGLPMTIEDLWRVVDRDLRYGQLEAGKKHLDQLINHPELRDKLISLREKFGPALLIKLSRLPATRDQSKPLLDLHAELSRAVNRDPERIAHWLENLKKSVAERDYAALELRKIGALAVPALAELYQKSKPNERDAVADVLLNMPKECWRPAVAMLDSSDQGFVDLAITLLNRYQVVESADFLWYVAGNTKLPANLRDRSLQALAKLTRTPVRGLPSPTAMLAEIAEQHARGVRSLGDDFVDNVELWTIQGAKLAPTLVSVADAHEQLANRFGRQALELDPQNHQVQKTLIALALERSFEKGSISTPLPLAADTAAENTLAIGPEALSDLCRSAMKQRRTAVVLGTVRALGAVGGPAAIQCNPAQVGPITQALDYPDVRVQFAAALAVLQLAPRQGFDRGGRVVNILERALHADTKTLAIVADNNQTRASRTSDMLQSLGYSAQIAQSGKDAFQRIAASSSVGLAVIDAEINNWPLMETIANLRADSRCASAPILILATERWLVKAEKLSAREPNMFVIPRDTRTEHVALALQQSAPDRFAAPLTPAEKAEHVLVALQWFNRMARGEAPAFDIRPAIDSIIGMLGSPAHVALAADALSSLPSAKAQRNLGEMAANTSAPTASRRAASDALARNLQRYGRAIDNSLAKQLIDAYDGTNDLPLRHSLAKLSGVLAPSSSKISERIRRLRPLTADDLKASATADAAPAPAETKAKADDEPEPKKEAPAEKPAKKKRTFFDDE